MKENYDGEVFGCMGCVQGDEVVTYKMNDELYVESIKRMWKRVVENNGVKLQNSKGNNLYSLPKNVKIWDCNLNDFTNVKTMIRNENQQFLRVTFSNGRVITCTPDHPFTTIDNREIHAEDLRINEDRIKIDLNQYSDETEPFNNPLAAWFLGATICDGTLTSGVCSTFNYYDEDDIVDRYAKAIEEYYGEEYCIREYHRGPKGNYYDVAVKTNASIVQNALIDFFEGIQKKKRHIPSCVFRWDRASKVAFLAGMIDADGYLNQHSRCTIVQIGSTNKELALQQAALARSLGYMTKVYKNNYDSKNKNKIRYRVEFIATSELVDALACEKKKRHYVEFSSTWNTYEYEDATVISIEELKILEPSYDVTTDSMHFTVSGIYSHNCRSFLSAWIDPTTGEKKWEGRFNSGVVTLNLPQIALESNKNFDDFWSLFEERLNICYEALMCRHKALRGTKSDVSPIHWQDGGIARLKPGEVIDPLLFEGYSTLSLGYIGLYECVKYMTGLSHTQEGGREFSLKIMNRLKSACESWKATTGIGFGLYGTPAESTCYTLCMKDRKQYGIVEGVTDKDWYTNSYH